MSKTYRIVVAAPQVPFLRGGAELHAELLVAALRQAGHETDLVTLPWVWTGDETALDQAMTWRLADFEHSALGPTDMLIATKFPAYLGRHPHKVAWVFHQERTLYDLHPTEFGFLTLSDRDQAVRQAFVELDLEALGEARQLFTNSQNTADRLQLYSGVSAEPLYAPPPLHERLRSGEYGDYLFFVGRLDPIKRLDLTLRALAVTRHPVRLLVAGRGQQRDELAELARELGIESRVDLLGFVDDEDVIELMAGSLAMVLTPHDEDYGFTTLEAFFAGRPVVTCHDAGGVLEFVEEDVTGFVVDPEAESIAGRIDALFEDRELCRRLGSAGRELVREKASWPKAIAALTSTLG